MGMVRLKQITKKYQRVIALDQADFEILPGEIHALLGENGAGKTTLMKVLYGMTVPDEGQIYMDDTKVEFSSPLEAISAGIGMVHQHFMQAGVLSVLENVIAGAEPCLSPSFGGRIDYKKARKEIQSMIDRFHFQINLNARVEDLSVGERQRVEILKVLYRGGNLLIFDEPTAVLTPLEVHEFFKVLDLFRKEGKSIVIITHKLQEVLQIADRITVMRDGRVTGHCLPQDVTISDLAEMMVKRDIEVNKCMRNPDVGKDVYFEVKDLTYHHGGKQILDHISLKIHKGEVLGIAGVEGNGQTELIKALTGLLKPEQIDRKSVV